MKHKDEWATLVRIGEDENLIRSQVILLLALREVEDGGPNNRFNFIAIQGTTLEEQARWVSKYLVSQAKRHLKYIRNPLIEKPMTFIEYYGWLNTKDSKWMDNFYDAIKQVKEEMYGPDNYDKMGI